MTDSFLSLFHLFHDKVPASSPFYTALVLFLSELAEKRLLEDSGVRKLLEELRMLVTTVDVLFKKEETEEVAATREKLSLVLMKKLKLPMELSFFVSNERSFSRNEGSFDHFEKSSLKGEEGLGLDSETRGEVSRNIRMDLKGRTASPKKETNTQHGITPPITSPIPRKPPMKSKENLDVSAENSKAIEHGDFSINSGLFSKENEGYSRILTDSALNPRANERREESSFDQSFRKNENEESSESGNGKREFDLSQRLDSFFENVSSLKKNKGSVPSQKKNEETPKRDKEPSSSHPEKSEMHRSLKEQEEPKGNSAGLGDSQKTVGRKLKEDSSLEENKEKIGRKSQKDFGILKAKEVSMKSGKEKEEEKRRNSRNAKAKSKTVITGTRPSSSQLSSNPPKKPK